MNAMFDRLCMLWLVSLEDGNNLSRGLCWALRELDCSVCRAEKRCQRVGGERRKAGVMRLARGSWLEYVSCYHFGVCV